MMTLPGFISLCTTFPLWAKPTAEAIASAISAMRAVGNGPSLRII